MASAWLDQTDGVALFTYDRLDRWTAWAEGARREPAPSRKPLTDAQVLDFINDLRAADPRISATRGLRLLRQAGYACEQQRFATLFRAGVRAA
jgi:hypothetical protein